MTLSILFFLVILLVSFAGIIMNVKQLYKNLRGGKNENRFDRPMARIAQTLRVAFAQTKLMREPLPGLLHLAIYWGFLVLLFAVLESIGEGFMHGFSFNGLGKLYGVITVSQDFFCAFILIAVIVSYYRRAIAKVQRLQVDAGHALDATLILGLIFIIVVSLEFQNAAAIACGFDGKNAVRPIARGLAHLVFGDNSFAAASYTIFWWVHIVTVLGFMNYLPYSKHLHVITSIPNVFFGALHKPVNLRPLNFEEPGLEKFGVVDVEDFTWKQLLDAYTCTECGRCSDVCPANLTGKVLNPKLIITNTRDRLMERTPSLALGDSEHHDPATPFVGGYQLDEALWGCTTCGACMEECPVMIEHVPAIIDMRRSLVMMESRFPEELQGTFRNLENNFTPWAFSHGDRAAWANGLNIPMLEEDQTNDEVLFWVGCAGSFDARAQKVSVAFSKIMQTAGMPFRILGTEEKCTGDPARRAGNEYLAQMLIKENVETLNRHRVKKIVTTCPHCLNTLKNEYGDFGGNYDVVHHTVFIQQLIDRGALKPSSPLVADITYHDPCYLGRHNGTYDAPRDDLKQIPGIHLTEMPRSRDKSFCCGAGGARMFMEEKTGERVNEVRTAEALATGASTIAAACPFCITMLTDGVKSKNKMEDVAVKDIAELIWESVQPALVENESTNNI